MRGRPAAEDSPPDPGLRRSGAQFCGPLRARPWSVERIHAPGHSRPSAIRSRLSLTKHERGDRMATLPHRSLGRTGLSVSAIGLGCMSLSGVYGEAEDTASVDLVRAAIDRGIDHFDSS